jgi:hypothetical protein
MLTVAVYFLKKVLNTVDKLTETVHGLDVKVAVILDRDRRRRIKDYDEKEEEKEPQ